MKIKIRSIHGHGKAAEEYVVLDVLQSCNAINYMVADTTYTHDGNISDKFRHTHWFYPADLNAGDIVVLLTAAGTDSSNKQPNGTTVHYRYWGLKSAIWNDDDGDGAILFEIDSWSTTKVSSTK